MADNGAAAMGANGQAGNGEVDGDPVAQNNMAAQALIWVAIFLEDSELFRVVRLHHLKRLSDTNQGSILMSSSQERLCVRDSAGVRTVTATRDYLTFPTRLRLFAICHGGMQILFLQ